MKDLLAGCIFALTVVACGQNVDNSNVETDSERTVSRSVNKTDFVQMKALAEQGDAQAQADLGVIYAEGQGVDKNYEKALKWYRKAAKQGNALGQNKLGVMFAEGFGVTKDNREAVKWFRKAADQGFANAQVNLGNMYATGLGVDKNDIEAFNWFRKAAEQGFAYAQAGLGYMYLEGRGVDKNETEAFKWFRKSAEKGEALGQLYLGISYLYGRGVPTNQIEAEIWFRKAAEQGDSQAQVYLGGMYFEGRGVDKNDAEAVKWYRKGAEQGYAHAQTFLGYMYLEGLGVDKNEAEAAKWYREAADQGWVQAQLSLGYLYFEGRGVDKNETEALKWYRKAAEQGDVKAQLYLGEIYEAGLKVDKNETEAAMWYRKAAEQGNVRAQLQLSHFYASGRGVDKNKTEALKWHRKAVEQGKISRQNYLKEIDNYALGADKNFSKPENWDQKSATEDSGQEKDSIPLKFQPGAIADVSYTKVVSTNYPNENEQTTVKATASIEIINSDKNEPLISWALKSYEVEVKGKLPRKSDAVIEKLFIDVPVQFIANKKGGAIKLQNKKSLLDNIIDRSKMPEFEERQYKNYIQILDVWLNPKNEEDSKFIEAFSVLATTDVSSGIFLEIPELISICQGTDLVLGELKEYQEDLVPSFQNLKLNVTYQLVSVDIPKQLAAISFTSNIDQENQKRTLTENTKTLGLTPLSEKEIEEAILSSEESAQCSVDTETGWVQSMIYANQKNQRGQYAQADYKIEIDWK